MYERLYFFSQNSKKLWIAPDALSTHGGTQNGYRPGRDMFGKLDEGTTAIAATVLRDPYFEEALKKAGACYGLFKRTSLKSKVEAQIF